MFNSCFFDEDGSDGVSPADSLQSELKVIEANAQLGGLIAQLEGMEDDSLMEATIRAFDFNSVNETYNEALGYDPSNEGALFGEAISGLLAIANNEELNSMFDGFSEYFDENPPFEVQGNILGRKILEITLNPQKNIKIPNFLIENTTNLLSKMSVVDVPQFSRVQAFIRTIVLPRIDQSITNIQKLEEKSNFNFGFEYIDGGTSFTVEFDLTEIYLIDGGLQGLKGAFNTLIAYNLDIESYDGEGMVTALTLGSDFATLYSTGSADLSKANSALQTSISKFQAAVDFLEAETDDQTDDFIGLGTIVTTDDLSEIEEVLADADEAYNGTIWVQYPSSSTPDSFEVEISKFFTNPINDFKAMIPPYTVTAGLDTSWYWNGTEDVVDYISYYPIVTWNADTYAEWLSAWPDPTFNEILPGFTTADLEKLLSISEEDWTKTTD
jgi:hypothetical protein